MNVKYLKLAPITAMMALAIFFASVGPTLAQCHVDDSDIRDDDCVLEPGTTNCDLDPPWKGARMKPKVNNLRFLAPPPIVW
ncbi:hypothetical protein [Yersinia aleksiciae]|uniref:Uncharacterized protein n=1 Tax=Yersinia aleksiciae TaxID=263819 RepID=A0ABM5UCP3_YERAE|nr:hypothetical protein [Yersinia aleksiciae]AKP33596.1 hypothetical protein ACZ76_08610 [Yersinia aleksiciae]MDA5496322.1 hypothetical protein [Yersinia aleksiciae]NIL00093.1 hypothetical protein [Yersinia aleksiciae]WQC70716.1 hypothetical protein N0K21_19225 [Yersinia aleksiciae]CFQ40897.1 Uncharacterised protein [Yersinia aleksiciae]